MNIIIVGCGRIGSGLAQNLSKGGHKITVIDKNPLAFEALGPAFKGQTVTGIGFDKDVLAQAKIERTDALAALTSSDEANVIIARMASQVFHVPKVVARLYDVRKAEIYKRLGLQTIDPATWGINRVADMICHTQLNTVATIGNSGTVDIVEVEVPSLLIGRKVDDVTVSGEFQVVAISRENKTILPTLGTTFHKDDLIHFAVSAAHGDHLKELLDL